MAYATPDDMVLRFDANTIGDLVSDTGVAATDLTTNATVLAALEAASGRVDAAALVSQNYSTAELAALTGNSLALLKDIVCDLAMIRLLKRRPEKITNEALAAASKEAEDYLDRLRRGDRLFDVAAHETAGVISVEGPTTLEFENLNLITARTKNYFADYRSRWPLDRS